MDTRVVTVAIKHVYGVEKIYPVSAWAEIFAEMLGQKTLTRANISHIKRLGFQVEVQQVSL
jgi:hypothetical protein